MIRTEALKLIANQLDFIKGTFKGVRDNFNIIELSNADVILTTLESAGMLPPLNEEEYHNMSNEDRKCLNHFRLMHTWEDE